MSVDTESSMFDIVKLQWSAINDAITIERQTIDELTFFGYYLYFMGFTSTTPKLILYNKHLTFLSIFFSDFKITRLGPYNGFQCFCRFPNFILL